MNSISQVRSALFMGLSLIVSLATAEIAQAQYRCIQMLSYTAQDGRFIGSTSAQTYQGSCATINSDAALRMICDAQRSIAGRYVSVNSVLLPTVVHSVRSTVLSYATNGASVASPQTVTKICPATTLVQEKDASINTLNSKVSTLMNLLNSARAQSSLLTQTVTRLGCQVEYSRIQLARSGVLSAQCQAVLFPPVSYGGDGGGDGGSYGGGGSSGGDGGGIADTPAPYFGPGPGGWGN